MHPLSRVTSTNLALLFHVVPSRDWFRNTLKTIGHLYDFVSMSDIELFFCADKQYNNCCHICFDDGDRSFYDNAYPVLTDMGIPASLFVSPKIINEGSNFWFQELDYIGNHVARVDVIAAICDLVKWDIGHASRYSPASLLKCLKLSDIKRSLEVLKKRFELNINQKFNITADEFNELRSSDLITIGAHTMNHPILSNESSDDVEWEIRTSINVLGEMLDGEVKYFAFPNGISGLDHGQRERSILEDTPVKLAFTTDIAFYNRRTHPLSIPRGGLAGREREKATWIALKLLLVPVWDKLRPAGEVTERKKINDGME